MFELLMLIAFLYGGLCHLLPESPSSSARPGESKARKKARRTVKQPAASGNRLNRPRAGEVQKNSRQSALCKA